MWTDNETDRDLLNFTGVAQSISELIVQAGGRPISIGVSGAWGIGKSSMIQLVKADLTERTRARRGQEFVFVDFNAWLYQGYDDARAALMEVIAARLGQVAEGRSTFQDKAKQLLKRVNWFRAGRLAAGTALSIATGLVPAGLVSSLVGAAKSEADKAEESDGWLKPRETPPEEIQALRDSFEALLSDLQVTLVVLIDDLDRCLPETTISTLEAIRLFLFMKHSAFVIAADQAMIKYAVKKHFADVPDETLVVSYFDKLIQVPIRVPTLGLQEIRAYLMMLFIDQSEVDAEDKERIRVEISNRLRQSWSGARVDKAFVSDHFPSMPTDLAGRLAMAERLAPIMSDRAMTAGNPRLIKRFLNALSIRMALGKAQGVPLKEEVLAKLLIFERSDNSKAYAELTSAAANHEEGKPEFLREWEEDLREGKSIELPPNWQGPFIRSWLELEPALADEDLRGALYVSREHAPMVSRDDRLSAGAAVLLAALLKTPAVSKQLQPQVNALSKADLALLMSRVLEKAKKEERWGAPDILKAALVVAHADPLQAAVLAAFLKDLPASILAVSIVPALQDEPWAPEVFAHWATLDGLNKVMEKRLKRRD